MDSNTQNILLTVFVGLTALAMLTQALVFVGIFAVVRKAAKEATEVTGDLKATLLPLVHTSRDLVERISPQIISISTRVAELTEVVHEETDGVKKTLQDILERVNQQTVRIDGMLTSGLGAVERAGTALESSISTPVRHANGIANAIKAVVGTYRRWPATKIPTTRKPTAAYPDPDRDIVL